MAFKKILSIPFQYTLNMTWYIPQVGEYDDDEGLWADDEDEDSDDSDGSWDTESEHEVQINFSYTNFIYQ